MNLKHLQLPAQSEVSRISVSTNPAYQEKLERYSLRKAEEARQSGASFVAPISQARRQQIPQKPKEEQKPKPSVIQSPPKKEQRPTPLETFPKTQDYQKTQHDDSRRKLKAQALAQCFPEESFVPQKLEMIRKDHAQRPRQAKLTESSEALPSEPLLLPGDLLYASNCLTVSSDTPGPVMAQILQGKLKGAKLLGSFQCQAEHLMLTFTRLILPKSLKGKGAREIPLLAYAIDPKHQGLALASSVDHHYFQRFAGLLASSFLQGFGDAVQRSGITRERSLYGQSTHTPHYDLSDQLWIAAGRIGQNTAELFQEQSRQAPTITLKAGTDLGILILAYDQRSSVK